MACNPAESGRCLLLARLAAYGYGGVASDFCTQPEVGSALLNTASEDHNGLAELVDWTEGREMLRCRETAAGARKGQTSDLSFYEMGF